ncbi:MAG: response regulator [Leeuwenhoekiella sp.]
MMFKKVLISEDLGSIASGIQSVLENLEVSYWEGVSYCDDAYLQLKKAEKNQQPYSLLITDLSFKTDHRQQRFANGEELLDTLIVELPNLKVIVYSIEDRTQKVRTLLNRYGIDGYVCKGRDGLKQLETAIHTVDEGGTYLSPQVKQAAGENQQLDISNYDILLMEKLAAGLANQEISDLFANQGVRPNSLSSIEKKILRLREQFGATNAVQLIAIAKDLGLL